MVCGGGTVMVEIGTTNGGVFNGGNGGDALGSLLAPLLSVENVTRPGCDVVGSSSASRREGA